MAQIQRPMQIQNGQTLMQMRRGLARIGYIDPNTNTVMIVEDQSQVPNGCTIVNVNDPNGTIACLEQNPTNCASLHPWRQYVDSQYCLLSPEVRKAIKDRTKIWEFATFFATVELTSTTQDFILTNDQKTPGLLNIKAAMFEPGVTPVIFQLRLGASVIPAGMPLGSLDYFSVEDTNEALSTVKLIRSALPPQVKNAELLFNANSTDVLKEISCNEFDYLGYGDEKIGTLNLPTPLVLPDQKEMKIQIKLPAGSAVPASTALRLEMIGLVPIKNYLNA